MRSLSTTLTSAQKLVNKTPIWKVVLSRSGQTTRGYDNSRLLSINRTERSDSYKSDITLHNSDGALTALDFENYLTVISKGYKTGISRSAWVANTAYAIDDVVIPVTANGYQYRCSVAGTSHATTEPTWPTDLGVTVTDGTVTWEMDGNAGDEYSRTATQRVRYQVFYSGMGLLRCSLHTVGIPDQLKEDKAIAEYTQLSSDTNTVKDLISAICAASTGLSSAYNGYEVITVIYDSEDSLIDTFKPADFFSIKKGESRWDKIQELLDYTKCKAKEGNDGALHILVPTISGASYDYEYKFNVSGDHNFWNKSIRLRFVDPNKEIVQSPSTHSPIYSGSATSATSYALAPKVHITERRLTSNDQAEDIAEAMIERYELDDEKGVATVPPNVGQELWDYVKVTDSRQGDTRIGNIQFIQDNVEIHLNNQPLTWNMQFSFGKITMQSLAALTTGGDEVALAAARLTNEQIFAMFGALSNAIRNNDARLDAIEEWLTNLEINITIKDMTVNSLTVTESLIIPSEAA